MRTHMLAAATTLLFLAGCSANQSPGTAQTAKTAKSAASSIALLSQSQGATTTRVANLRDRGELTQFDTQVSPQTRGATTFHAVSLSEAHARNAIGGELVLHSPEGTPIRLKYDHHVDHGNGNWTWVGRPAGAQPGTEAIITFGKDAVFGAIPNGANPLELTMAKGRTWMAETDLARADALAATAPKGDADFVARDMDGTAASIAAIGAQQAPKAKASAAANAVVAGMRAESATPSATTVDLMIGYSAGLTTRVGSESGVITRLTHIVDVANQSYANSQVGMQLRLVHAESVAFSDASSNRSALFALSGLSCTTGTGTQLPDGSVGCTPTTRPAPLNALMSMRDFYGADVVTLVRATAPEQLSCGLAWLGGAQQTPIENYADLALSVISDSTGATSGTICRDETLAHEVGHNMGLQHDRTAASNNNGDGILDANEYGSRPWSFGMATDGTNGNFIDIMGQRTGGQTVYRVFSNPRINFCGGRACGVVNDADNALALAQNIPAVANYRQGVTPAVGALSRDADGNGRDDFMWFNPGTRELYTWFMNGATPVVGRTGGFGPAGTTPQAGANFGSDTFADIVFANGISVTMYSGNGAGGYTPAPAPLGVQPAGSILLAAADFDNNGRADLLWLNPVTRALTLWRMNGTTVEANQNAGTVLGGTSVLAAGDFNGDHRIDVLLGNTTNLYMLVNSATGFQATYVVPRPQGWQILATQDINADGKSDVLWYNSTTREIYYWLMNGNAPTTGRGGFFAFGGTAPITAGDYNGDGRLDVVLSSGAGLYMMQGNATGGFDSSYIAATPIGWTML